MQHIPELPLPAHERGFQTTFRGSQQTIAVGIAQKEVGDQGMAIKVTARVVDSQGAGDLRMPSKTITVNPSALAEGSLSLESILAEETVNAIQRLERFEAAMEAWATIPVEPPPNPE